MESADQDKSKEDNQMAQAPNDDAKPADTPSAKRDLIIFFVSMVVSFACYWMRDGAEYAAMLTLVILVHEMGHFVYMKKAGLAPRFPIFVPYFGAFVQPTARAANPAVDAWASFAGPFAGGMAAVACYHFGQIYDNRTLVLAGNFGFLLNLLQLVPIRPFDGGFIAESVSKWLMIPGLIMVALLALTAKSWLFQMVAVMSVLQVGQRFRAADEAARLLPAGQRVTIAGAYVGWICILGYLYYVSAQAL